MNFPFRSSERLYLRALEHDDLGRCQRWITDPEISQFLTGGRHPVSMVQQEKWLRGRDESETDVLFAICLADNDLHIGNAGLHGIEPIDRHATFGLLIGERTLHGKGYGTEAARLVLDYAFDTLNLERINLTVYDFNPRALRSYLKVGFVEEGRMRRNHFKAGEWRDEIVMGLLRDERKPAG